MTSAGLEAAGSPMASRVLPFEFVPSRSCQQSIQNQLASTVPSLQPDSMSAYVGHVPGVFDELALVGTMVALLAVVTYVHALVVCVV